VATVQLECRCIGRPANALWKVLIAAHPDWGVSQELLNLEALTLVKQTPNGSEMLRLLPTQLPSFAGQTCSDRF